MCGIGGVLRISAHDHAPARKAGASRSTASPGSPNGSRHDPIPRDWIDAISANIAHRGPDDTGLFTDRIRLPGGNIADLVMIHQRLAIIDPRDGRQPMVATRKIDPASLRPDTPPTADADDLLAVVFNGCIYNHRELRRELAAGGAAFRTDHSDTESILHSYARWQTGFAARLEGMFAAAVWDRPHGRLVLARDVAGEKPLYITAFESDDDGSSVLAFASTVPALVALRRAASAGDGVRIDPKSMTRWIRFGFDSSVPIVGISQIPPMSIAIGPGDSESDGPWKIKPYDALPAGRDPTRTLNLDDLDRLLARAVERRLEADVSLGCFLSGGIDSSLVAAYAKRVRPDLATFCVRMPDPRYDESSHARTVARRLNTRHTTLDVRPAPADDLARLIPQLGLPLGDSSLMPTHWVSAAARTHVTVALSGDGGDELFLGYDRYRAAGLLRDYGPLLRAVPSGAMQRFHPRSKMHKLGRLASAARHRGYEDLLAIFPGPWFECLCPGVDQEFTRLVPAGTRLTDPARLDFSTYLPEDLLRKVDTASMAVALEVRSPMLAKDVINAALATPTQILAPRGQPKGLLRLLARRYLPDAIVTRPKSGFAVPIAEWLRSDFGGLKTIAIDLIGTPSAAAASLPSDAIGVEINARAVVGMLDDHLRGRRDHSQRIYALMVLAIWSRWITGEH